MRLRPQARRWPETLAWTRIVKTRQTSSCSPFAATVAENSVVLGRRPVDASCMRVYLRLMSHNAADRIRNVALIGHRGCGKTSLHEAMLFEAGAVNRLGTVEGGSTVSDHEDDERARGLS